MPDDVPAFPSANPATLLGKLSNVPELPPHFLPRPEELNPVKALLLMESQEPVAVTGASRRVGLHGMGGIGKSVLATALAWDKDVRAAFPDGVFWLALGQEPAIIERQTILARSLSNQSPNFTTAEQGRAYLGELLAETTCLIILDDVWQMSHLKEFNALGPRCCLMITTRDLSLITALGAREHRLDVLGEDQALVLLAQWADQNISEVARRGEAGGAEMRLSAAGSRHGGGHGARQT